MFSYDPTAHHLGVEPDVAFLKVGQPMDALSQRQQTDSLPSHRGDSHGLERELQFIDLNCQEAQAMG